jgi:large subunit ribosomal protein L4
VSAVLASAAAEADGITRSVNVQSPSGDLARSAELPAAIFDVAVNVPLIHQVVVAQLAAARQGTADTKTRGEVSGGGKKPYRQKGTGRARQGSTRSPQFAGGGVSHGPTPRSYAQRTPKKMKVAALRGALSDRARHGRVHVVSGVVDEAINVPSTKAAAAHLRAVVDSRHVLVVAERRDELTWKSLRNVPEVHLIAPGQLNTYDVLVSDDVVFTEGALAEFLAGPVKGRGADAVARESELDDLADAVSTLAVEPPDAAATTTNTAGTSSAGEPAVSEGDAEVSDDAGSDAEAGTDPGGAGQ